MVKIIEFEERHLNATYRWMQDEDLKKSFLLRKEITPESHKSWFSNLHDDKSQLIFAIEYSDTHCGNCGLKNINLLDKNAELWLYLGESALRGKGIAKEAMRLLLSYSFEEMNLHKIHVNVLESNKASYHLCESNGFKVEGYLQDEVFRDGCYESLHRMSLIHK